MSEQGFTQTIDWLAFTVPDASIEDVFQLIGGEWFESETGFRGYPVCWMLVQGQQGVGKIATGAPRRVREVHVDLSAGIVSNWEEEKVKAVLQWVFSHGGHVTRLDIALDDREACVSIAQVKQAVDAGQAVTRSEKFQAVSASSLRRGESTGETLYFGSRESQTMLRIYDKRLERQQKGCEDWDTYGVRWELEFKKERAQACAKAVLYLDQEDRRSFLVGVLRSYVDFRATTRDATAWEKYRAALLPWWAALTEGFRKCRLAVETLQQTIEQVKQWMACSVGPLLAVVHQVAGPSFLKEIMRAGRQRWRSKHRALLSPLPRKQVYVLHRA